MILAAIFDLNGTVLADEEIYGYSFKRVLLSLGVNVESDHPHKGGIGVSENWPFLLKKYKVKTEKTIDDLTIATQEQYLSQIDEVELKDGFLELANNLKDSEIKIALATSNTWSVIDKVLEKFELTEFFDVITTKEEVEKNKPDPSIFLLTAEKLMIDPEMCVVFEDSESGVEAAKSAGMKVVGMVRDRNQKQNLKKANLIIEDFLDMTPELFGNID